MAFVIHSILSWILCNPFQTYIPSRDPGWSLLLDLEKVARGVGKIGLWSDLTWLY